MPDCGHTFCEFCVADILTATPKQCSIDNCRKLVRTKDLDKFVKNQQLLQIIAHAAYLKPVNAEEPTN